MALKDSPLLDALDRRRRAHFWINVWSVIAFVTATAIALSLVYWAWAVGR
jgi:hypothetical protein